MIREASENCIWHKYIKKDKPGATAVALFLDRVNLFDWKISIRILFSKLLNFRKTSMKFLGSEYTDFSCIIKALVSGYHKAVRKW